MKSFSSLFVKEDLSTATPNPKPLAPGTGYVPPATPPTYAGAGSYQPQPSSFAPPYTSAGVDPEIRQRLLQMLHDNQLAGFDYLKFVQAMEEMKGLSTDESARFKMAFIAAKQIGSDKGKLTESAQHYLKVLENGASDFASSIEAKTKESVTANEQHLQDVTANIENLKTQLTQLQQQQITLSSQITENRAKLENAKRNFDATYSNVVSEIQTNIQKINQYLQ